jgi:hypothetical protein
MVEIILRGETSLFMTVFEIPSHYIEKYKESKGIKDSLSAILYYLKDREIITDQKEKQIREGYSELLMSFSYRRLPAFYFDTPAVERAVRSYLDSFNQSSYNCKPMDDSEWLSVSRHVKKYVSTFSSNGGFTPGSKEMVGWIINSCKFLLKKPEYYSQCVLPLKQQGLNMEIGDSDVSYLHYHSEDTLVTKELKNFGEIADKIFKSSEVLYKHNRDIYYDIFSRIKAKRAKDRRNQIKKVLSKLSSYQTVVEDVEFVDINIAVKRVRSSEWMTYVLPKMKVREDLLKIIDPLLNKSAGMNQLPELIEKMYDYNSCVDPSDGKLVFSLPNQRIRSKLTNDDRMERIYAGYKALSELLSYMDSQNISIFNLSSEIFKNENLARRDYKFSEYLQYSEELIEISQREQIPDQIPGLRTNDDVYRYLEEMRNSMPSISFKGIKEVVEAHKASQGINSKEPLLNLNILKQTESIINSFYKGGVSLEDNINLYHSKFIPYVNNYVSLFKDKGILKQENGLWSCSVDFNFLYNNLPEGPVRTLASIFQTLVRPANSVSMLDFFRTFEIIKAYLFHVKETIMKLINSWDYPTTYSSRFSLFVIFLENSEVFTLPKKSYSLEEAMFFIEKHKIELYLDDRGLTEDVSNHILSIFTRLRNTFNTHFSYLIKLRNECFNEYSFGSVEIIPNIRLRDLLKPYGIVLYNKPSSVESENNQAFKNFSKGHSLDAETGFFTKGKEFFVKENILGSMYLHERGYWVVIDQGKVVTTIAYREGDLNV